MKRKRFSEEQIIGILKAAEVSGNIRAACQEHNVSEQTFYRWRQKYGGMEVSEAKKLRDLERENGELKKMVAELSLDSRMLKELNEKNGEPGGSASRSGAPGGHVRGQRAGPARWSESLAAPNVSRQAVSRKRSWWRGFTSYRSITGASDTGRSSIA